MGRNDLFCPQEKKCTLKCLSLMNDFNSKLEELRWTSFQTAVSDGNMSYKGYPDEKESVKRNLDVVYKKYDIQNRKKIVLSPLHLNSIIQIETSFKEFFEKVTKNDINEYEALADGVITNSHDYVFLLRPADCAGVFIASKTSDYVAFLHVGLGNIITKTIETVMNILNTKDNAFSAFIFRHIHKDSYFHKNSITFDLMKKIGLGEFTENKGGKYFFDLTKAIKDQLTKSGINDIIIDPEDNYTSALNKLSFSKTAYNEKMQEKDYRFMVGVYKK